MTIQDTEDTRIGTRIAELWPAQAEGLSGFHPLIDGIEALSARLLLAERAELSIDTQYYLIKRDNYTPYKTISHIKPETPAKPLADPLKKPQQEKTKEDLKSIQERAKEFSENLQKLRKESMNTNKSDWNMQNNVEQLKEQANSLTKELKKVKAEMFSGGSKSVGDEKMVGEIKLISHDFGETDRDTMSAWADSNKELVEPVLSLAVGVVNDKKTVITSASAAAVKSGINIGTVTKELLSAFGGRGGGKPNFAQGSLGDSNELNEILAKFEELLQKK